MSDDTFDPTKHTVEEVQAHLSDADDTERDRVLALEAASSHPRKTLVGDMLPPDELDPIVTPDVDPDAARTTLEVAEPDSGDDAPADGPGEPAVDPAVDTVTGEQPDRTADTTDDAPADADDVKPVWNVATHGKPNAAQREKYTVIGD